ncbi:MAG: acyl-CoA reductase [Flavobacteriaceae bacterium]
MQTNIMSGTEERIQAFVKLGGFIREYVSISEKNSSKSPQEPYWHEKLDEAIQQAGLRNGWFTKANVLFALKGWGELLNNRVLNTWLAGYEIHNNPSREVAIITAGNIPLVGFHDLLCVLITGNKAVVKCSSNDNLLLPLLMDFLVKTEPYFEEKIEFTEGFLEHFDAVIATGSNNTSRYFEYYFGKKPHIIRKNRNSVAVLSGKESHEQLELLGEDVFRYFGLGCRSVSKIFIPRDFEFDLLFEALYRHRNVMEHVKYSNNYEYNKAVYLMSEFKFLDNGFFMLKEDQGYASPISTLFYEYYDSTAELSEKLIRDQDQIQCLVAEKFSTDEISFGQTQHPGLKDYADGVDTVEFLLRT